MTYYRIGLFDIIMLCLSNGLWVLWMILRDDETSVPDDKDG